MANRRRDARTTPNNEGSDYAKSPRVPAPAPSDSISPVHGVYADFAEALAREEVAFEHSGPLSMPIPDGMVHHDLARSPGGAGQGCDPATPNPRVVPDHGGPGFFADFDSSDFGAPAYYDLQIPSGVAADDEAHNLGFESLSPPPVREAYTKAPAGSGQSKSRRNQVSPAPDFDQFASRASRPQPNAPVAGVQRSPAWPAYSSSSSSSSPSPFAVGRLQFSRSNSASNSAATDRRGERQARRALRPAPETTGGAQPVGKPGLNDNLAPVIPETIFAQAAASAAAAAAEAVVALTSASASGIGGPLITPGTRTALPAKALEAESDHDGQPQNFDLDEVLGLFWTKRTQQLSVADFARIKQPMIPVARVKKIMKLDPDTPKLTTESVAIMTEASALFVEEITIRALNMTNEARRRVIRREDYCLALDKDQTFDFLIDFLGRPHSP